MVQVIPLPDLARPLTTLPPQWAGEARGHRLDPARRFQVEAFFVSTGAVALAEMGDKTQLLAFLLAARFRRPAPIILGILIATLANHAFAGAIGTWVTTAVNPEVLRWILGLSFLVMAVWILVPDKIDEDEQGAGGAARFGVLGTTIIAFFLAEMGDKTQIATVALAAHYASLIAVVAGTTAGMMIANVPAVFLGDRFAAKLPLRWIRGVAAVLFAVLGIITLVRFEWPL